MAASKQGSVAEFPTAPITVSTLELIERILHNHKGSIGIVFVHDDRWVDSLKMEEHIKSVYGQYSKDTILMMVDFESESSEDFRKYHGIIHPPVTFMLYRGEIQVNDNFYGLSSSAEFHRNYIELRRRLGLAVVSGVDERLATKAAKTKMGAKMKAKKTGGDD